MVRLITILVAWLMITGGASAEACDAGSRKIEHLAGTTCMPEKPQRIVPLHGLSLAVALYEFGAGDRIVAIADWPRGDGRELFTDPAVQYHTSLRLEDDDYAFLFRTDFERLVSLKPDLIIGRQYDLEIYDQLSAIAPTVLLSADKPIPEFTADIANTINEQAAYERVKAEFLARAEAIRLENPELAELDVALLTVSPGPWTLVYQRMGAIHEAFDLVGIRTAPKVQLFFTDTFGEDNVEASANLSLERLDIVDADLLILPYWYYHQDVTKTFSTFDHEKGNARVLADFEKALPGYCQFLRVCQAGQMMILEATPTYAWNYSGLHAALDFIEAEIVGRKIEQIIE